MSSMGASFIDDAVAATFWSTYTFLEDAFAFQPSLKTAARKD
jgi:hypothetical protein